MRINVRGDLTYLCILSQRSLLHLLIAPFSLAFVTLVKGEIMSDDVTIIGISQNIRLFRVQSRRLERRGEQEHLDKTKREENSHRVKTRNAHMYISNPSHLSSAR